MKILHIINSLQTGGAEKLIVDGLPFYAKKGVEIDLLVLCGDGTDFEKKLRKKFSGNIFLMKRNPYNPILIFDIVKYLKSYDALHIHLFPSLYWGVFAKLVSFSKIPIIYTEHNTSNRRRNSFVFKVIDKFVYSYLDFIGCISNASFKSLVEHLDLNNYDRVEVINNGIDLTPFFKNKLNKYQFFGNSDFVLIQVSSFRKQKDQITLIKSLQLLPEEIKLILVGDGPLLKVCKALVLELGLGERVSFLGIRNDIPDLYYSVDLAVQSSNYEGFGLVAVEAMASGKAIIASDVEGLNDVVRDAGLLFTKGNEEDLADKILTLFTDENYRNDLEVKCIERSKLYDINHMINKYVDIYISIK